MQVSVETTGTLGRKVSVTVPAEKIEEKIKSKLQELSKTIKMDGFRPGKVPLRAIEQRYGKDVYAEIANKELQESLFEALSQEKLHPAGTPAIEAIKAEKGQPLEYTASFEIYPEIKLAEFANIQIEKETVEITEQDIDKMIENIRKQQTSWEPVERAAATDDKLIIDFKGMKDGEVFAGGSAEGADLVLGANSFIPGFEEGLVGVKVGDEKTLELTFPEDYHVPDLAGKAVSFEVQVKSVNAPQLPELNEEFAKKMGVKDGGMNAFRTQIKEHMQKELENVLNNNTKKQVFDKLLEQNKFEVPTALIEHEGETLMQQRSGQQVSPDNEQKPLPEPIKKEAQRRVSIGLILAEIIKQQEMKADQEKVREHIEKMASSYQQPEQIISWYYSNKDHLASVEGMVLEDQVLKKILEQAVVSEKAATYDEVMNPKQTQA